jgi:type IV pilus assembly protein PilN
MANINLLPWREELREQKKREFYLVSAFFVLVAVSLLLLADLVLSRQIDAQNRRNAYVADEISVLNAQVAEIRDLQKRRTQLLDRMRVIQELQGNRPIIVRVMDQLVRTIPDGVYYTSLNSQDGVISIRGVAESNNRVSSLMRNLDASAWFSSPNLDSVRAAPEYGPQATTFNLSVKIQPDGEGAR